MGWSGLFGSFGEGQSDWIDLVPYPDLFRESDPKSRMSAETLDICKRLINKGEIPYEIVAIMLEIDSRLV